MKRRKKKREKDDDESDHIHSPSLDKLIDLFLLFLFPFFFQRSKFNYSFNRVFFLLLATNEGKREETLISSWLEWWKSALFFSMISFERINDSTRLILLSLLLLRMYWKCFLFKGIPSMADNYSSDEYRCHSCPNQTFKHFSHLLNHLQDSCELILFSLICFFIIHRFDICRSSRRRRWWSWQIPWFIMLEKRM